MSALICLLGMHGSGKTAVGRSLRRENISASHISCGDLVRFAKRSFYPDDVPYKLMSLLAKHQQGTCFLPQTAELLASYLIELSKKKIISVDGFPSDPSHIKYLQTAATDLHICHVFVDQTTRQNRLITRGEQTKRKWNPNSQSERDLKLNATLQACRDAGFKVSQFDNTAPLDSVKSRFGI